MRRTIARAAATAGLASTSLIASALGLGEINVESSLNQRLLAVIPITEVSAEDLETVSVALAPNDAFERAGVDRADYLSSLNFEIKNDRAEPRVVVSSNQIAREPVLNLLIQVRWKGGRLLREYTVLLDPPTFIPPPAQPVATPTRAPLIAVPSTPAPQPSRAPAPQAAPVMPPPMLPAQPASPAVSGGDEEFYRAGKEPVRHKTPSRSPSPVAVSAAGVSEYGPVKVQETLWGIARAVRPAPTLSMDQVQLGLVRANPTAFDGLKVRKGALLSVPTAASLGAVTAAEAREQLQAIASGAAVAVPVNKPKAEVLPPVEAKPSSAPVVTKPAALAPAVVPAKPVAPIVAASAATAKPVQAAPAPAVQAPAPAPAKPVPPAASAPAAPAPVVAKPSVPPPPAPVPAPQVQPAPSVSTATPPPAVPATAPVAAVEPAAPTADAKPVNAAAAAPVAEEPVAEQPAAAPPEPVKKAPPRLAQSLPPDASERGGGLSFYATAMLAALVVGLLILLGLRRRNAGRAEQAAGAKPTVAVSAASAATAAVAARLADETKIAEAAAMQQTTPSPQPLVAPQVTAGAPRKEIDPVLIAALDEPAPALPKEKDNTAFDMTQQMHANTVQIDVKAGDPLSEADMHMAYGLYDEAIVVLKKAALKEPRRQDIKLKLAETYFAAGRPLEFQELAEQLKPSLDEAAWSKLAIMGSQLCPGVALFRHDAEDLETDFDLGLGDDHQGTLPPIGPAPVPAPVPAPKPVAAATPVFDIPALETPNLGGGLPPLDLPSLGGDLPNLSMDLADAADGPAIESAAALREADTATIDFTLGQSITPIGASGQSDFPDAPSGETLEFKLDNPAPAKSLDVSLKELEASLTPPDVDLGGLDDEFNTKLDLARAYVEMGDHEMARGLLQEVQQQGGPQQQDEARAMLQRLPG